MTAPSVIDLLSPPSADAIESLLLAYLTVPANPVTDFNSGAVQLTMLRIELEIVADLLGPGSPPALQSALAGLLGNGYPDTAVGQSLDDLATGWYGLAVSAGSFAVQTVTLACDAGHGPYTFTAGLQEGIASDGAIYVVAGSGTLSAGGTLTLDFNARSVGLAQALISQLGRGGLPGVSVQSAAIKLVGGVPQFGSDPTTDGAIAEQIAGRWPDLAAIPAQDRAITWALAADPTITRCRLDPDAANAGGVILTVAGSGGPVAGSAVTAARNYVLARQAITDYISVNNASAVSVSAGGTATVPAGQLAQVQAAAEATWTAYLSASQIGGSVYLLQLIKAVMDAGATNFTAPTLNGVSQDVAMGAFQVPFAPDTLANLITWVVT